MIGWLLMHAKTIGTNKGKNADCIVCGLKQTSGNIWAPAFDKDYSDLASFKCDFIYWINTELLSSSVNKIYKRGLITELYPENMSFGEGFGLCIELSETLQSNIIYSRTALPT